MVAQPHDTVKRVAVIGGGFSGCSTAYFLRLLLQKSVAITIFERSERIGGRVRSISADCGNEMYEIGGAIYTGNNKYMNHFVKEFGLSTLHHAAPDEALSLYSGRGRRCAFSSNAGPLFLNRLRFALLYSRDFIRFRRGVNQHLSAFDRIYDLQKKGVSFDSPIAMLGALSPNFLKMLKSTFENWLAQHLNLSGRFCKEVVYGLVSNCYCSNLTLHAFAGMTAVTGFGAELFSVIGGNAKVAQRLSEAALHPNPLGFPREVSLNTTVTKLLKGSSRRFLVVYEVDDVELSEEFDFVVLAFPIHQKTPAMIDADKDLCPLLPSPRKYVEIDFTHFRGELDAREFGLPSEKSQGQGNNGVTILPTYEGYEGGRGTLFKYLGRAWSIASSSTENSKRRASCWSAFTLPNRASEPGRQLLEYYTKPGATLINSSHWFAYPLFSVVRTDLEEEYGKFLLADGLIYVNALEGLASNMEMALIGGCNAALLIANSEDFKATFHKCTDARRQ